jgi:predicted permease
MIRLPGWLRRRRSEDIAEEIEAHVAMATRDYIARGLTPEEARAAATREFGNVMLVRETTREVWSWTRVEHFVQDVKFGARILRHAPGLSAVAILLIALVIGGNATVYSMVNSMLVSPASGVTPDDLIVIRHVAPGVPITDPFVSFPNFEDYARHSTTVTGLVAWTTQRLTLGTPTGNFALSGGLVTTNYFDTFGVDVAQGRGLVARDDVGPDGVVVVISHRVWQERFHQAEDVIGTPITVNRVPATIVGVAPAGFAGATLVPGEDFWMPIRAYSRATSGENTLTDRAEPFVLVAGRLSPSASLAQARSEFATLAAQAQSTYADAFTTISPRGVVVPLHNARAVVSRYSATALLPIADMAPVFLAVFSVVTLLTLIIVCANVANLLLGRTVERQRDTAVRYSLGASRTRIARMLLAEGATLAIAAWIAAYIVAWWTSQALLRVVEPRPGLLAHARPDWTLAAYGMTLALLAALAFSLAPALRSWRVPVLPLLKAGEHSIARGRSRLTTALVVVQFAFSVLLVTSAGLAYRSMTTLSSGDLGFNPENLLLVTVRLGGAGSDEAVADGPARFAMLERVRERLAATAGVEDVSYARRIPGASLLASTRIRRDAQRSVTGFVRQVGPDYLRVLGLKAASGRELTTSDRRRAARVAMINQRLAMELFANEPPIGRSVFIGDAKEGVEIVGIVPDALFDGPNHDPHPRYLFVAEQQMPGNPPLDLSFFIRHRGTVEAVTPIVHRAIGEVDASLPIVSTTTMNARIAMVTELETQIVRLLVCFAVLSLVIAALGHYAVAMFNMRRRTREFGVRIALGASSQRIQSAVVREALVHTVPGLIIGFALSVAVAISFKSLLFGVTPVDPITYLGVFVLLTLTSIVASYLPARRASRVNVVDALRQE